MRGGAHLSKDVINIPLHAARYSRKRASPLWHDAVWCSLTARVERKSLALSRRTAPGAAVAAYAPFPCKIFGCRQRPARGPLAGLPPGAYCPLSCPRKRWRVRVSDVRTDASERSVLGLARSRCSSCLDREQEAWVTTALAAVLRCPAFCDFGFAVMRS